jgi:hypothetical protein
MNVPHLKRARQNRVEDVITIGPASILQKAALPDGSFLPCIESEFETWRRLLRIAERFGGKNELGSHLNLSALYELLAAPSTPPEVQAEVERSIAAGEIVSAADAKRMKGGRRKKAASDWLGSLSSRECRACSPGHMKVCLRSR